MDRPCPFITFYSFKGGVGRSMAVINVAGILAARGFRVLVIDMDLEAPGISYLANEATQANDRAQPGFVDFLLDAVERDAEADLFKLPPDHALDRYSAIYQLPDSFLKTPGGSLHIMPAGRLDAEYPSRLDRLDLPSLYREGSGLALVRVFKDIVQQSRRFDYVFIDSRTGFSDESGICTRDLADYLMVVSGLNKQNVEGTTQFLAALAAATPERKPLAVILSPVPNGEDALVDLREQTAQHAFKAAWGSEIPTNLHIPYHPQLALTEEPHIFRRGKGYLFDAYCQIERHLLSMLGETPEAWTGEAITALKNKNHSTAVALLRRARMVSDTNEWLDGFTITLASTAPLPGIEDAKAVYDIVIENASPQALQSLIDMVGQRAVTLWDKKRLDAAESMFRLALKAGPTDADNLGGYANFLCDERRDLGTAETMYKRALDADPTHADNLGNYATFLCDERRDVDTAETMYKRALVAAPKHADNLGNYATFLWHERRDQDAAEAMYKQALDVDRKHAQNLGNYANFLLEERRDWDAAEAMYKRALKADPKHANNLGNYGRICLETSRVVEGMEFVDRAIALLPAVQPSEIDAECWMYVYCCGAPERRLTALTRLRQLVMAHAIKTGEWDFTGVIRQARSMQHPEEAWLPALAEVLAGRQPSTLLDTWAAWGAAE